MPGMTLRRWKQRLRFGLQLVLVLRLRVRHRPLDEHQDAIMHEDTHGLPAPDPALPISTPLRRSTAADARLGLV